MAFLFYLIGWIVVIVGVVSAAYNVSQIPDLVATLSNVSGLSTAAITPVVAAISAGAFTVFSGMLILAIGGVLARLDRIARNTRAANG